MTRTSDTRITGYEPLLAPSALLDQLPLGEEAAATVERSRGEVRAGVRRAAAGGPRAPPGRSADRDARVLREAAHGNRLEGPDQRPGHGRRPRRAPRPGHRPPAAPRHRRGWPAGGLRMARPDHA